MDQQKKDDWVGLNIPASTVCDHYYGGHRDKISWLGS